MIANAIFPKVFWHLKVTQPFMCLWVNQVYRFLCQRNIFCQFTSLDFHIIRGGFRHLPGRFPYFPGGKFTIRSHPGKFLKVCHIPQWIEQFPPGHWDRVLIVTLFSIWLNCTLTYFVWLKLRILKRSSLIFLLKQTSSSFGWIFC